MNKNFTSGASSVTVQYSVTGNCQDKVSFTKNGDFISTSKTSTSVTISVSENRGEARTGYVYTSYDGTRCNNNTITITQAAGPCTTRQVSYRYDNYSGSVEACDTSKTVTVSGVKTTTYNDPSCGQETEEITTSVTLNFDKNTSSDERTIQSSFTINNSNFTVFLAQPGGCSEPVECELDSVTFTPNPNQTFNVDGCYTSATITLSGTSVSSYTNCESTSGATTKSVDVHYDKNESSEESIQTVTVSGVSVTLNRSACGSPEPEYENKYFTIESLENENVIVFDSTSSSLTRTISVSTDGVNWSEITSSPEGQQITTLESGQKLFIKGNNEYYGNNTDYNRFFGSKRFNVYGNIMSLIYGDSFENKTELPSNLTFRNLFGGASFLTSAENLVLPTTVLTKYCYFEMFYNCQNLAFPPELPAMTLADDCYYSMFNGCTSLTTAPELLATELAYRCYYSMFYGCTSLTTAPELPATELAYGCCMRMFAGCTKLTTAPQLPATTLVNRCYDNMFSGCTSLEEAPELPATTLADGCYIEMFRGCNNLNSITCLATDITADSCAEDWLNYTSTSGTFVKAASMNDWTTGVSGIPEGWTVQDA